MPSLRDVVERLIRLHGDGGAPPSADPFELILSENVMRGYAEGEDVLEVTLRKGRNDILAKITQGGGGWEAGFAIVDKKGKVMKDLKFGKQ